MLQLQQTACHDLYVEMLHIEGTKTLKYRKIQQADTLLKLLFSPLNAELNPICHLLALLGSATIVVVSRLRVNYNCCIICINCECFCFKYSHLCLLLYPLIIKILVMVVFL
jgi:hypothetical protein